MKKPKEIFLTGDSEMPEDPDKSFQIVAELPELEEGQTVVFFYKMNTPYPCCIECKKGSPFENDEELGRIEPGDSGRGAAKNLPKEREANRRGSGKNQPGPGKKPANYEYRVKILDRPTIDMPVTGDITILEG